LAGIAVKYDQWNLIGADLTFTPRVPADTKGTIMGAFIPDFKDPIPDNSGGFLQLAGSRSQNVWMNGFSVPVRHSAAMFLKKFYVAPLTGIPGGADASMYYGGNVVVATEGCDENINLGQLFWTYTYRLINPVPPQQAAQDSGVFQSNASASTQSFQDVFELNSSGISWGGGDNTAFKLEFDSIPATNIIVTVIWWQTTITGGGVTWANSITGANIVDQSGTNGYYAQTNTGSPFGRNCAIYTFIIEPTALEVVFGTFTNTLIGTGFQHIRVMISPLNRASPTLLMNSARVVPGVPGRPTTVVPRPLPMICKSIYLDKIRVPKVGEEKKHERKFLMTKQGHCSIPVSLRLAPEEEYYDEKLIRQAMDVKEREYHSAIDKIVAESRSRVPCDTRPTLHENLEGLRAPKAYEDDTWSDEERNLLMEDLKLFRLSDEYRESKRAASKASDKSK